MTHPDHPPPPPAIIWRGLMQDAAEAQIPTRREAESACDLAIEVWRLFACGVPHRHLRHGGAGGTGFRPMEEQP